MNYSQTVNKLLLIIIINFFLIGCIGGRHCFKRDVRASKEWLIYSVTIDSSTKKIDSLGRLSIGFEFPKLCIKDNRYDCTKLSILSKLLYCEVCPKMQFFNSKESGVYNIGTRLNIELHCSSGIFYNPIFPENVCLIFDHGEGTLKFDRDSLILDIKSEYNRTLNMKIVCIDKNSIK